MTSELFKFPVKKTECNDWNSRYCDNEICGICGKPASSKLEEVIFDDDPADVRHPLKGYVCYDHFQQIVGMFDSSRINRLRKYLMDDGK